MDGRTEGRARAQQPAGASNEADRAMKAKPKPDATAGKQTRRTKAAKKLKAAPQTQSSNSLGDSPSIQSFPAGQTAELRDEDWKFGALLNEDRATLVAACWYEYARESPHVGDVMSRWLERERIINALRPYVHHNYTLALLNAGREDRDAILRRVLANPELTKQQRSAAIAELNALDQLPRHLCDAFASPPHRFANPALGHHQCADFARQSIMW